MSTPSTGLWRHADFRRLWVGQTISQFGAQITLLALPLVATLALQATPVQMGLLTAAGVAPHPLLALGVGVWVDRQRRRPILLGTALGRAGLLLTIPAATLLGVLRIELLYAVALLAGVLAVCFDVAYQSYLPALIGRDQLVEGNSKLQVTQAAALVAGPGLAGGLIQLASAPLAIVADVLSLLCFAVLVGGIRAPEPPSPPRAGRRLRGDIGDGLRLVAGNPLLRAVAGYQSTGNLFTTMILTVLVLYATRSLGIGPAQLGLIVSSGSVGFLVGALLAAPVAHRAGPGPAIVGGAGLSAAGVLVVPLATGPAAAPLLAAGLVVAGIGAVVFGVNQMSLRQAITPDRLQGRMNATMRFVTWSSRPLGALVGGILGERIGLQPTLAVGAVGGLLALLWLWFSPLPALREPPRPAATLDGAIRAGPGSGAGDQPDDGEA